MSVCDQNIGAVKYVNGRAQCVANEDRVGSTLEWSLKYRKIFSVADTSRSLYFTYLRLLVGGQNLHQFLGKICSKLFFLAACQWATQWPHWWMMQLVSTWCPKVGSLCCLKSTVSTTVREIWLEYSVWEHRIIKNVRRKFGVLMIISNNKTLAYVSLIIKI